MLELEERQRVGEREERKEEDGSVSVYSGHVLGRHNSLAGRAERSWLDGT